MDKNLYLAFCSNFCKRVIDMEGGFVNDPSDPGLATMYGISSRFNPDVADKIINRTLTKTEAERIYIRKYIEQYNIDKFILKDLICLAFLLFDSRVSGHKEVRTVIRDSYDNYGYSLDSVLRLNLTQYDRWFLNVKALTAVRDNCAFIARSANERLAKSAKKMGLPYKNYYIGFYNRGVKRYNHGLELFNERNYQR